MLERWAHGWIGCMYVMYVMSLGMMIERYDLVCLLLRTLCGRLSHLRLNYLCAIDTVKTGFCGASISSSPSVDISCYDSLTWYRCVDCLLF